MLPADIPGLGPADEAPKLDLNANLGQSALSPEDYFVLSRVDGSTTVKQIVALVSGMFPEAKTVDILKRLKLVGAILIGPPITPLATGTPQASRAAGSKTTGTNRAAAPFVPRGPAPAATPPAEPLRPGATRSFGPGVIPATDPGVPSAPPAPLAAASRMGVPPRLDAATLAEVVDLDDVQKRRILEFSVLLAEMTHFEVLGIAEDAEKKDIKRAYFKLSKEFHPDRFYKKQLGSYGERLGAIFKALTVAFDTLSDESLRAGYLLTLKSRRR